MVLTVFSNLLTVWLARISVPYSSEQVCSIHCGSFQYTLIQGSGCRDMLPYHTPEEANMQVPAPSLQTTVCQGLWALSRAATHSSGTTAHWTALAPAATGQSALSHTPQWLQTVQWKRQASFRQASLLSQFSLSHSLPRYKMTNIQSHLKMTNRQSSGHQKSGGREDLKYSSLYIKVHITSTAFLKEQITKPSWILVQWSFWMRHRNSFELCLSLRDWDNRWWGCR